jgi:hypothetical protein
VRRFGKIELVQVIHLNDPPRSGKGPGEGWGALGHVMAESNLGALHQVVEGRREDEDPINGGQATFSTAS